MSRLTKFLASLLLLAAAAPARSAPDAPAQPLDQVAEQLASQWTVETHLKQFTGPAIQVYADRTDWPLNWRLAFALTAAPQYAMTAKDPVFKSLLEAKLKSELLTAQAETAAEGLIAARVKLKAQMTDATTRLAGAWDTRAKAEQKLYDSLTPQKIATAVSVISMLEKATPKELDAARKKLRDAIAKALQDDPASLKLLQAARAAADQAAGEDLRKARARLTESIQKTLKP